MRTTIALVCVLSHIVRAQPILVEHFDYPVGTRLTEVGWTAHSSAGVAPISVSPTIGLSYPGYAGSGEGLAAELDSSGEDLSRIFSDVTSGTITWSFLVNVAVPTAGYFIHLGGGSTSFAARVFVRAGSAPGTVNFGISNSSTASYANPATNFAVGTTFLVVVTYEVSSTGTARLWVIPSGVPVSEAGAGTPEHTASGSGQPVIDRICLRQYSPSQRITVDGIRVGLNWNDAPLPVQLSSLTAVAGARGAELKWRTESEVDNAGFEVERRAIANGDPSASLGVTLSIAEYQKVGFVAGAGTSTSPREYSFTDAPAPGRYAYRLKQVDRNGTATYHGEVEIEVGTAPRAISLGDNYPNPFNPSTTIEFSVETEGPANLTIYDMTGREVATLFDGIARAGFVNRLTFDARSLASGTYIYRLQTAGKVMTKRMMLVK